MPKLTKDQTMLTVKNIHQYYGGSHILRDVSFTATLGKVTVLLGRNGVGKTTLLKSLMGLVPIKSGSIEFDGLPIQKKTPYERARAGMGFVPQGREIFARLTVEENLRMGLAYKSGSTPIPAELFELFPTGDARRAGARRRRLLHRHRRVRDHGPAAGSRARHPASASRRPAT
jgi:ABC-type branched-subunit amino acid transport system ATPase component